MCKIKNNLQSHNKKAFAKFINRLNIKICKKTYEKSENIYIARRNTAG